MLHGAPENPRAFAIRLGWKHRVCPSDGSPEGGDQQDMRTTFANRFLTKFPASIGTFRGFGDANTVQNAGTFCDRWHNSLGGDYSINDV